MTDKLAAITDADIEAACSFLETWEPGPELTQDKLARAFSAHRLAERERILAIAKDAGVAAFKLTLAAGMPGPSAHHKAKMRHFTDGYAAAVATIRAAIIGEHEASQ